MIKYVQLVEFYEAIQKLTDLIASNATPDKASEVCLNVADDSVARIVFDKPISEKWFASFIDADLFAAPPLDKFLDGTTHFSSHPWPALWALRANAETNSELVWSVLKNLSPIQNDRLVSILTEIVIKDLPGRALEWAELEVARVEKTRHLQWTATWDRRLIDKLIEIGQHSQALELANALLEPALVPNTTRLIDGLREAKDVAELKALMKMDDHEYGLVAELVAEKLVDQEGISALKVLTGWLAYSIKNDGYKKEPPEDLSTIWYENIAEKKQYGSDAHEVLVQHVYSAAVNICEKKPSSTEEVVDLLWECKWLVFKRIGFLVLRDMCKPTNKLLLDKLNEALEIDENDKKHAYHYTPEYWLALNWAFEDMGDSDKETHLHWVEEYPSIELYNKRRKDNGYNEASDEEKAYFLAYRRLELLKPVIDNLPERWAKEVPGWREIASKDLQADQERQKFHSIGGPKTSDEVAEMSVEDILKFLDEWEPGSPLRTSNFDSTSLARVIANDVQSSEIRTDEYIGQLQAFSNIGEPTWCWAVLEGLEGASLSPERWNEAIKFCEELISWKRDHKSAREEEFPHSDFASDMNWTWRKVIDLIQRGFTAIEHSNTIAKSIPIGLAERAFNVVKQLATNAYFGNRDPFSGQSDYATAALNNLQSRALEALIDYGVYKVYNQFPDEEKREAGRCYADIVPELFETLDEVLGRRAEWPLYVLSIFGSRLPRLIWLDEDWVKSNLSKMFAEDNDDQRKVVWSSFIKYTRAHSKIYGLVAEQFQWAVDQLKQDDEDKRDRFGNDRLAQHLGIMFWWNIESPNASLGSQLIEDFFKNANDKLRAAFIRHLAQNFPNTEDDDCAEITERLLKLWEWRNTEASKDAGFDDEMEEFLGFFIEGLPQASEADVSKYFELALQSLHISSPKFPLSDGPIAEALKPFAKSQNPHLKDAIELVTILIKNTERYAVSYSIKSIDGLIRAAADDDALQEAQEASYKLINILGSLGVGNGDSNGKERNYRALLPRDLGGTKWEETPEEAELKEYFANMQEQDFQSVAEDVHERFRGNKEPLLAACDYIGREFIAKHKDWEGWTKILEPKFMVKVLEGLGKLASSDSIFTDNPKHPYRVTYTELSAWIDKKVGIELPARNFMPRFTSFLGLLQEAYAKGTGVKLNAESLRYMPNVLVVRQTDGLPGLGVSKLP